MLQVTAEQGQRASQVVALLRTWVLVMLETHSTVMRFLQLQNPQLQLPAAQQ